MSVDIKNVYKEFDGVTVLEEINFTIEKNTILALLGPNGAGKSTTMRIITGAISPTKGEIWLQGVSLTADPLAAKRKIGYLPENNPLYLDMYVKEYLSFIASFFPLNHKQIQQRVKETIIKTGLESMYKKKIYQLSKGYRQRVGIAQALIHDPEILILDEPTSGLDPSQLLEIRKLLKEIKKDKTIIFSTHILQEVEELADIIAFINKGVLVCLQNTQDFLKTIKKKIIKITFAQPYSLEEDFFSTIPSVIEVKKRNEKQWHISTQQEEDVCLAISQKMVAHQLFILSMYVEKPEIEDVFKELIKR